MTPHESGSYEQKGIAAQDEQAVAATERRPAGECTARVAPSKMDVF
jgi:hypothetical protein